MPFTIYFASHWTFLEQELQAVNTPLWVPPVILLLMILLFVWGLTRGDVLDENLPDVGGSTVEIRQQDEVESH